MPASNAKKLSSLFRAAAKTTSISAEDVALKQYVSAIDTSSPYPATFTNRLIKNPKGLSPSKQFSSKSLSELTVESMKCGNSASDSEQSIQQLKGKISAILHGDADFDSADTRTWDGENLENYFEIPWFSNISHNNTSLHRKEISRERKHRWVYKSNQTNRFERLVKMCAQKLGSDSTIEVFGKLGRETGVKEYNAFMKLFVEKARKTDDEEVSLEQIHNAYQLFKSMKEQGFPVNEGTYGPFLMYLIDLGMVEEFYFFCNVIKDEKSNSVPRLAYYEMLLWIGVNNEEKIKELCDNVATNDGDRSIQENYLLALCERDRKNELLPLLDCIDITEVSSLNHVAIIFRSLGRLSLESFAKKFILALKTLGVEKDNISDFIYNYAISMPNLAVEDILPNFNNLHADLEVKPSSVPYEKLIRYCCDSLKVHTALDIVEQLLEAGLPLSMEIFHSICNACEESCNYNLVHHIYSLICLHNLKPNSETFRCMINLKVKMKDFDAAYGMIRDIKKMNLMPTASMYNAIMAGYFREKNIQGGLRVFKEMEDSKVKPDSQTYGYLIGNCNSEEDIAKYYKGMIDSGIQFTKHVYMALIKAYAACRQFEKAKQVILGKDVPGKILNEIKCVLVSALASHGKMSDALNLYEEIKQDKYILEPRAIISLIEHLQNKGELNRLLQLLEEINEPDYWIDGCFRVILYCVRHKHLSSAVNLLKKLKDKFCNDAVAREVLFDEVFSTIADAEPVDLQIGLDLLQAIKEELGLRPSRKSLDFLLSACANAKDLQSSLLIWKEYEVAGLPYNVLTFLRMYQTLLAVGDSQSARKILTKIPKDDPHVLCIIEEYQIAYGGVKRKSQATNKTKEKEKEKEVKKKAAKNKKKVKNKNEVLVKEEDGDT